MKRIANQELRCTQKLNANQLKNKNLIWTSCLQYQIGTSPQKNQIGVLKQ